jgi:hypothetical protein
VSAEPGSDERRSRALAERHLGAALIGGGILLFWCLRAVVAWWVG